ncbi:MAG: hypothetical protein IIZ78_29085 [Clostridiales bacterium]|nr:hypothetical protein [Clostridiales bacterium]
MSRNGWIKLYRKIEDCPIWFDDKFDHSHAWIDLLLMANHRPKTIIFDSQKMEIETGQILTSVRKLSARWGWCKDTTLSFLRLLEDQNMIVRDANAKRTLLTIVNYGFYQGDADTKQDTESDTKSDTEQDTESPQTRSKEYKNNNNVAPREQREKDIHDFEIIYKMYPKKKAGKQKALQTYLGWTSSRGRCVNGRYYRLTNKQVWDAVKNYLNHNDGTEQQYLKNFDTLMNQILDWIPDNEGDNE